MERFGWMPCLLCRVERWILLMSCPGRRRHAGLSASMPLPARIPRGFSAVARAPCSFRHSRVYVYNNAHTRGFFFLSFFFLYLFIYLFIYLFYFFLKSAGVQRLKTKLISLSLSLSLFFSLSLSLSLSLCARVFSRGLPVSSQLACFLL